MISELFSQNKIYFLLFISICFILIGFILFIIFGTKKEKSISGTLITAGLGLITKSFDGTNNIWYWQTITGFILLIVGIYLFVYDKNKLYILNINGYYDRRIETNFKDLRLDSFGFKEIIMDFVRLFKEDSLKKIILDELTEKIKRFINETKQFKRAYTGIAPIPFIIYSGKVMAREHLDEYFEWDKKSKKYYKLKRKYPWNKYPKLINDYTNNINSEEIVIAISITQEIKNCDLNQFENIPVINFKVKENQDNVIIYKKQLFEYTNEIINLIEKVNNIKKIHLVCACQSCLALELGQRIDDTRMSEIVSYHYSANNDKKYPWGIILNGNNFGNIIE